MKTSLDIVGTQVYRWVLAQIIIITYLLFTFFKDAPYQITFTMQLFPFMFTGTVEE